MNRHSLFFAGSFITALILVTSGMFLHCDRDNPYDILNPKYKTGKKPHVHFVDSIVTGFIFDTIPIRLTWSDTATGNKPGAINKFFFDWMGNGEFSDSINGSPEDTITLTRVFLKRSGIARVKAVDDENDTSAIDSVRIEIAQSIPEITSIEAPATVEPSVPFSITVTATAIGSSVASFHWAIDGTEFSRTTSTGTISVTFDNTGDKTILVKVSDSKNIESAVRAILIRVTDPLDTIGPYIAFLSPIHGDTVPGRNCVVSLQLTDVSGISGASVNDVALQLFGTTWRGTVPLVEGDNILAATAIDGKGNASSLEIRVVYSIGTTDRTPPVILLVSPPRWDDTVTTGSLVVKLMAIDESGIGGMFLSDIPMTLDPQDSSYFFSRDLVEGKNSFTIHSIDRIGNEGYDTLRVFYEKDVADTSAPAIAIVEPRHLQRIADTQILARGTVTDASGIFSLLANGRNAAVNYPDWNVLTKLKHGYDTITVVALDASVNRNRAEKSMIVIQNRAPRFVRTPHDTIIPEGATVSFALALSDDDDSLAWVVQRAPSRSGSTPVLTPNGVNATVSYAAMTAGIDTFRVIATDPWEDKDTAYWRVFIQSPADSTPFFTTDAKMLPDTITALDTLRTEVHAEDPNGLPLVYSPVRPPTPAGIAIDSITGGIVWRTTESDTGAKIIAIEATNRRHLSTFSWNLFVRPFNWAPVLSFPGHQTTNENQRIQLTLQATDRNNDPLEFSFGATFPAGARLD
ncbi:MAG: hypothetical protein JXA71_05420, partial [Chitinispirillaceae bacterium]|nr:hypothetical protein [Chitinispirillaceae bacterium]